MSSDTPRATQRPAQADRSGQHMGGTPDSSRAQGTPAGKRGGPAAEEGGGRSVERGQGPRKP